MLTIDEYKKQNKDWNPALFNIRGNKSANKALIAQFAKENNINEGQALDYMLHVFAHTYMNTENTNHVSNDKNALTSNVSNENTHESTNTTDYKALYLDLKEKQAQLMDAENNTFSKAYLALKKTVEEWLPRFFNPALVSLNDQIQISHPDMIALLVDYAERDPSNEFPFEPVAKEIFERTYKTQPNE